MNTISSSRWPAILSWVLILSLAGFVVYRNARSAQSDSDTELSVDSLRVRVLGEELIGLKSLTSLIGPAQAEQVNQSRKAMVDQLDFFAHAAVDRIHAAIVVGEISGKDQALARLDTISREPLTQELQGDIAVLRRVYANGPGTLDAETKEKLIQRHDFFARVALSYGETPDQEPRHTMEAGAIRSTMILGIVALGFLLLLLASVGFFIAAIVLKLKGRLKRAYVPDATESTAFLEGFALYFVLFILGFGLLRRFLKLQSLQWEWLAWLIIPLFLGWLSWRGVSREKRRLGLGWNKGRGVIREIGAGIAGYLAGIVVMAVGIAITYLLVKQTGLSPEHPLINMLQGDRWHILGLYGLVAIFAPVMEETMFRGALFHHLRRRWGWAISAPIVAFIFAIIHPQGWVAVPALGSIALVLAALREWRGSLIAPMVAHACNNFIVLTIALALLR